MGSRQARARNPDPTVYPEEERMGEEMLQRWIAELLRPLLERWLNREGHGPAFVGADQFIYYTKHTPTERLAPDVYVLPGVAPATRVRSWKTFETGIAPSFALEIVSSDWEKDYAEAPPRYAHAGVGELVVFDPEWRTRPSGLGARFQLFRRASGGSLRLIETTDADRVRSRALGCWVCVVGSGDAQRLRLATGAKGDALVPTAEEAALAQKEDERAQKEAERAQKEAALAEKEVERAQKEVERAQKEVERAQKEDERAQKEAERAQKEVARAQTEAALARVAALEAELARMRDPRAKR